ncbi:MAG: phosphoribosyltransferase [Acidimicrobiia bacterium]
MRLFRDRVEAGQRLAARLAPLAEEHPVVLGLPRGGVPVAYEVARALDAPLDVIVVRKLGVPFQPELGMGAVGEDGVRVLNEDVLRIAGVGPEELARVETRERAEVEARARRFRGGRPRIDLTDRTVIVVDDGIATGGTARAALQVARGHGAKRVVLAVPVAPPDTLEELRSHADEVVCLESPTLFFAIGEWYGDFSQVPDEHVISLLAEAAEIPVADATTASGVADPPEHPRDEEVSFRVDDAVLAGHLTMPAGAVGLVLFAHGSGSSRHSPRNQFVARALNDARVGTLLFDLLSPHEELTRANVFDVELLADRLIGATHWAATEVDALPIGYFGASTGAAAALWAAAEPGSTIAAVVSRGGRPDLAIPRLGDVRAPTLLIVGGHDDVVIELNREAARHLRCEHRLEIVPRATHLFEEPGTLETVATLAADWFTRHLAPLDSSHASKLGTP